MTLSSPAPAEAVNNLIAERARFRAYLGARLRNESAVDDFLLNSLVKAIHIVGDVADEASLKDWFSKVLRHADIEHVRSRPSAAAREYAWHSAIAASVTDDQLAIHRCFAALITTLKPKHAALLHLVELDGTSVWTAATALGVSANSAWVTLYRARLELRAKLETFCRECAHEPWSGYLNARSA